jgi:hypothetical protein
VNPLVRFDAILLAGAALQCALVLASRRFRPQDWFLPLFVLVGGSLAFFGFLRICSPDISEIADSFIVGFAMSIVVSSLFVAEAAPPRLSPTALLSLTITFWAAYWVGNMSHAWLVPALAMTLVTVLFAAGFWSAFTPARLLLQAWSLMLAAALSADGVPARVAAMLKDWRHEELAPTLPTVEVLMAGAQFFLLAQMACGLILLYDEKTWSAWAPSGRDERPRPAAVVALLVQGSVFLWMRHAGENSGGLLALATFGALAHGAMSGDDAASAAPRPVIDPQSGLTLTPQERRVVDDVLADARDFAFRNRVVLGMSAAAFAALLLYSRWS